MRGHVMTLLKSATIFRSQVQSQRKEAKKDQTVANIYPDFL